MIFGQEATVESVGINDFEEQPHAVEAAKEMSLNIAKKLRSQERSVDIDS